MARVPALDVERLAPQLAEARDAPNVGRNREALLEHLGRGEHLAQDRAGAQELHADLAFAAGLQSGYMPRRMPVSAPSGIAGCA